MISLTSIQVACLLDRPGQEVVREKEEVTRSQQAGKPTVNYNFQFLDREKYSQSKKKLEVGSRQDIWIFCSPSSSLGEEE